MTWIEYDYVCNEKLGITLHKKVEYNEVNLAIAKSEACDGNYTITEDEEVVAKEPLAIELGGTDATTPDDARVKLGAAAASVSATVTISGWSSNTVTVNDIAGVTANNHVIVTPHPDYYVAWTECMVRATGQGANSLTFVCEEEPSETIKANVLIVG